MLNKFIAVYEGSEGTLISAETIRSEEEAIEAVENLTKQFPRHKFTITEDEGEFYHIKGELIKGNTSIKPPLGLKPKYIHDAERATEIKDAIDRYMECGKEVPFEWLKEFNRSVIGGVNMLRGVSTKELVNELVKRQGVNTYKAEFEGEYKIMVKNRGMSEVSATTTTKEDTGPVIILEVID